MFEVLPTSKSVWTSSKLTPPCGQTDVRMRQKMRLFANGDGDNMMTNASSVTPQITPLIMDLTCQSVSARINCTGMVKTKTSVIRLGDSASWLLLAPGTCSRNLGPTF